MTLQEDGSALIVNDEKFLLSDILYIRCNGKKLVIKMEKKKFFFDYADKVEAMEKFEELECLLEQNKCFIRCDKSIILNLAHLNSILVQGNENEGYDAKLNFD